MIVVERFYRVLLPPVSIHKVGSTVEDKVQLYLMMDVNIISVGFGSRPLCLDVCNGEILSVVSSR